MLYREIMAVCSEIHTKQINTVCGQKVELLNVKLAVCKELKPERFVQETRCTFWNLTLYSLLAVIWPRVTDHRTSA